MQATAHASRMIHQVKPRRMIANIKSTARFWAFSNGVSEVFTTMPPGMELGRISVMSKGV